LKSTNVEHRAVTRGYTKCHSCCWQPAEAQQKGRECSLQVSISVPNCVVRWVCTQADSLPWLCQA